MRDPAAESSYRAMNPWVLHLQKLGLELKCPLCLNFYNLPTLLPCSHLFCRTCIPRTSHVTSECPICKNEFGIQDLRHVSFMENIVTIFRSLDAAFAANVFHKVHDGVGQNGDSDTCRIEKDNKFRPFEALNRKGLESTAVGSLHRPLPSSGPQVTAVTHEEPMMGRADVINQGDRTSFDSPLSFVDPKSSDNDSSDRASDHCPEDYSVQGSSGRNADNSTRQEKHNISVSEAEGHLRDCKRQKKLDYYSVDMGLNSHSKSLVTANNEEQPNLDAAGAGTGRKLLGVAGDTCQNKAICGFCQTSRVTEVTGPMLHYLNGKKVNEYETMRKDVMHVHHLCTEWAPKVYYEGECIKNLEAELARSSRLKCCKCGLKGAALGCYVKSCRRSYHIPCAREVDTCRWDINGYLLLCPTHYSIRFPSEKQKTSKPNDVVVATEHTQIVPQECNFWGQLSDRKCWNFCGSALSSDEKFLLVEFASMIGVPVSNYWSPSVTHVIASTDADGVCTRTFKVLMAISTGKWVLKMDWIRACMEAMGPINEEPYEVGLDNHGCRDGPKTGRIRALGNAPKLFEGFYIYFSGAFVSGYKEDLQNLVVAAGGTVLRRREEVAGLNCKGKEQASQAQVVIVYSLEPPPGLELGEEVSVIWKRVNEAQDVASEIGGRVTGHTWLLESIAAHKLQPLLN